MKNSYLEHRQAPFACPGRLAWRQRHGERCGFFNARFIYQAGKKENGKINEEPWYSKYSAGMGKLAAEYLPSARLYSGIRTPSPVAAS